MMRAPVGTIHTPLELDKATMTIMVKTTMATRRSQNSRIMIGRSLRWISRHTWPPRKPKNHSQQPLRELRALNRPNHRPKRRDSATTATRIMRIAATTAILRQVRSRRLLWPVNRCQRSVAASPSLAPPSRTTMARKPGSPWPRQLARGHTSLLWLSSTRTPMIDLRLKRGRQRAP